METGMCSTERGKLKHVGLDQRGSLDTAEDRWVGTSSSVLCTAPTPLPPFPVLMPFPYVLWAVFQGIAVAVPAILPLTGRWKAAGSGGCCWQSQPPGHESIFTANPPPAWIACGVGWRNFNRKALWSSHRTLASRAGWPERQSSL